MSQAKQQRPPRTLAAVGFDVIQCFGSLKFSAKSGDHGTERHALVEQQQRFELWAINIGLHQLDHASLDYRFRDASDLYELCDHLLTDLAKYLHICRSLLSHPFYLASRDMLLDYR
jgi:hypothetical protein